MRKEEKDECIFYKKLMEMLEYYNPKQLAHLMGFRPCHQVFTSWKKAKKVPLRSRAVVDKAYIDYKKIREAAKIEG